jgi:mono/diheme cytochrome c family protein
VPLSNTKAVTLFAVLALASAVSACSSGDRAGAPANTSNAASPAKPANAPTNAAPTTPETAAIAGMDAATEQAYGAKCAMCHGKDAKGKGNAPNLLEVRDKHTSDEWAAYLKNPKIWEKDNTMPPANLSADESKHVSDWLAATTGKAGAKGGSEDDKGEKSGKTEGIKKS